VDLADPKPIQSSFRLVFSIPLLDPLYSGCQNSIQVTIALSALGHRMVVSPELLLSDKSSWVLCGWWPFGSSISDPC
jgi:hypothetical protein